MVESEMTYLMCRFKTRRTATFAVVVMFVAALWLSGCGNFWQNPYGTTNQGGTTTTTTTLSAPATAAVGASVTLTAAVSPAAATGTVTFYSGASSIGSATLSSGTATATTSFAVAGTESVTATYGGSSAYGSSTSGAQTVTVSASAAGNARGSKAMATVGVDGKAMNGAMTSAHGAAAIHATRAFSAVGGSYTAKDAEAAVVEGDGSVSLSDAKLSAAAGDGRGVLVYRNSAGAASANGGKDGSFSMSGGAITYTCDATTSPACTESSSETGQSSPATLFAVANTRATISLTDVAVTNNTSSSERNDGTLLTAAAVDGWGTAGANGGHVAFVAKGTKQRGDVIVDDVSTAELAIVADEAGTGSSLTGAVNNAGAEGTVTLTLDPASLWIVTGTSHVTRFDGLAVKDGTVSNIDGGGHCVYYSGEIDGAKSTKVYMLSGGGALAPEGTKGLKCD